MENKTKQQSVENTDATLQTGSFTGAGQIVGPFDVTDVHALAFHLSGTFSLTWIAEITVDGTNWEALPLHQDSQFTTIYQTGSAGTTARLLTGNVTAGQVRFRCSAYVSGTGAVSILLFPGVIIPTTINALTYTQGMVAEDAAAGSTSPVQIGGVASNAERSAMSADADAVKAWFDRRGRFVMKRIDKLLSRITTAATTVALTGAGVLGKIVVPTALTGAVTVYDNTAASGTVLLTLPIGYAGTIEMDVLVGTGITVVTAGADQVLVIGSN